MEASSSQRIVLGATDRLAIALDLGMKRDPVSMTHVSDEILDDAVTSLYRRFRPQRFAELKGQDHIVRALQGSVAHSRVSHAYLFSGPRGTGKTTTARILAKALNCDAPIEGDACGTCSSCIAIAKGASLDVFELDAASNNGVDAMRYLTESAWQAPAGKWKVYILDEVHQLSKAAAAALLKTLEEPPSRVVFVLATTDPHKVLPTLRSRTQHLEFRLFGAETLHDLLSDVRGRAGLDVADDAIEAAVRLGRGSARDALSAFDRLVATGEVGDSGAGFGAVLDALLARDPSRLLSSLADLLAEGWDVEQLAVDLASELRQAFLLQVSPAVADAIGSDRERLSAWGSAMGLPSTVRALESLGVVLREMKNSPSPRALLEVALVRLVHPELERSLEGVYSRLEALERGGAAVVPVAPAPSAAPRNDVAPRRAIGEAEPPTAPNVDTATQDVEQSATPEAGLGTLATFTARLKGNVLPKMPKSALFTFADAHVTSLADNVITLSFANEQSRNSAEATSMALRKAIEFEFKTPVQVNFVVGSHSPSPVAVAEAPAPTVEEAMDDFEYDEPATSVRVESVGDHLISEMFPGAEEIS